MNRIPAILPVVLCALVSFSAFGQDDDAHSFIRESSADSGKYTFSCPDRKAILGKDAIPLKTLIAKANEFMKEHHIGEGRGLILQGVKVILIEQLNFREAPPTIGYYAVSYCIYDRSAGSANEQFTVYIGSDGNIKLEMKAQH